MNIADIPSVYRILGREYLKHKAPVAELIKVRTNDPFHILVATILSSRTRDETTAKVCNKLFARVKSPADLEKLSIKEIEKLIKPIGFFHTKAKLLHKLPFVLKEKFNGKIPDNIEELCELPGVGRKTANLVTAVAFNKPAICVDVHVHRICNRLGLIKTRTPFETEMKLRKILPRKYWIKWNAYLVSYGQTICKPINPKCFACHIASFCDKTGIKNKL